MEYTSSSEQPIGRRRLAAVIRAANDIIKIDDVAATLAIGRLAAAKLLSRWAGQGWLRRVGRGTYIPVPMDSLDSQHVLEDPWVLVPALFTPAYIGGWTAAEHWDLTEQLFRDIIIMTAQTVREKRQVRHGAHFALYHVQERKIFGTKPVWRGRSKVLLSDVHRTVIDMLDNPSLGGGIQHVSDCLDAYLKRPDRSDDTLTAYAERLGNGAVFKRLGFLADQHSDAAHIADVCRARLTAGNAKLDTTLRCSRLISKWCLWVPSIPAKERHPVPRHGAGSQS